MHPRTEHGNLCWFGLLLPGFEPYPCDGNSDSTEVPCFVWEGFTLPTGDGGPLEKLGNFKKPGGSVPVTSGYVYTPIYGGSKFQLMVDIIDIIG